MSAERHDDWRTGQAVRLSARVQRVLAPNPGRLTGPGTNSYLIGSPDESGDGVILDPGPDDGQHVAALCTAQGARPLRAIVLTHSHRDHSPGAATLFARTGAPRVGRLARYPAFQDPSLVLERQVEEDARIAGAGWTLRALLTPGHASNHVCWYLEEERALFTGDHILGTVSPVILPPDGDMGEYLDSLRRLLQLDLTALYPGHGPRLEEPRSVIGGLIAHRLAREAKVSLALGRCGAATLDELLPHIYDDVDPALLNWARYSLEAHLIKLEREGRALRVGERWQPGRGPGG